MRAQVDVNSTGARGGRPDEESGDLLPPAHLERVQGSVQWDQNRICQVRAQRGCAPSCYLKNHIHPRQVVWQRAVLPRRLDSSHATMLACARYSGLLYVVRIAFRRVVECERVNCA